MIFAPLLLSLFACTPEAPPPPPPVVEAPPVAPTPPPAPPPAAPAVAGDVERGKVIYGERCVACHQADGAGLGGALGANFKDDAARMDRPDAELLKSINEGMTGKVGTMPPWKDVLTPQEQADALAYIRTFRK